MVGALGPHIDDAGNNQCRRVMGDVGVCEFSKGTVIGGGAFIVDHSGSTFWRLGGGLWGMLTTIFGNRGGSTGPTWPLERGGRI
eukprot:2571186-Pyramimonas_sp.AAC.1